jgi:hypothetical protein
MKKITLILAFIGMITLTSCVRETIPVDNTDYDTYSEVFEYSNVNFTGANNYGVFLDFPHSIFTSDMALVYRLVGSSSAGDIWKLLPETYFFSDGTLDYRYDFNHTRFDAEVYMEGFELFNISPSQRLVQVLRVVVIPASFGNKSSVDSVDVSDYNAVIKHYEIDDKNITKINL